MISGGKLGDMYGVSPKKNACDTSCAFGTCCLWSRHRRIGHSATEAGRLRRVRRGLGGDLEL
jgi:hypothetical protein